MLRGDLSYVSFSGVVPLFTYYPLVRGKKQPKAECTIQGQVMYFHPAASFAPLVGPWREYGMRLTEHMDAGTAPGGVPGYVHNAGADIQARQHERTAAST